MMIQDVHIRSVAISTQLSQFYIPNLVPLLEIVRRFNEAKIRFVLVGSHALGGWLGKPRASSDVDVLVAARNIRRAVATLTAAFPHLVTEDDPLMCRLCDPETRKSLIDLFRPVDPLSRAVWTHTHRLEGDGQRFYIPSLEMALALTYTRMVKLPWSSADKYQAAHDFGRIIHANPEPDWGMLAELGALAFPDTEKCLIRKVRRIRAGARLTMNR